MNSEFQPIVESLPDGVLIVSDSGIIVYMNSAAERLLGYLREDLLGRPLEIIVPEGKREAHKRMREGYLRTPSTRPMGEVAGIVARRRDGSEFPAEVALSPLGGGRTVATIRDASPRLRVERDLRQAAKALEAGIAASHHQTAVLQSIVDSIGDGVVVLDLAGCVQLINPAAIRIYPAGSNRVSFVKVAGASGAFLSDQTTPFPVEELLLSPVLSGENVDGVEIFVRHSPAAEGLWTNTSARPLRDVNRRVTGAVLAIRDTTERKAAQEALLAGQEAERKRIARELHDSAAQSVCALILEIDMILRQDSRNHSDLTRQLAAQRERLVELADEMSSLAHRLHPTVLERFGLAEALRRVSHEFRRKRLHVEFSHENIPDSIAAASALCVYRVTQEALHNVLRHARTQNATVALTSDGATLCLRITDSGVGFDHDEAAAKGRLGLISIRERVRLAGGAVAIHSGPGQGVRIDVSVPVRASASPASRPQTAPDPVGSPNFGEK